MPAWLLPLALTLGAVGANSVAAGQQASARKRAVSDELARQRAYDSEIARLNASSLGSFDDFSGQQDASASALSEMFTNAPKSASGATADAGVADAQPIRTAGSGSDVVTREAKKQSDKARMFTDQQGAALGQLRSFGDLLGGLNRQVADNSALVSHLGGFKQGSAAMLPYALDDANRKGANWQLLGDLLSTGAALTTSVGAVNAARAGTLNLPDPTTWFTRAPVAANLAVGVPPPSRITLGSLY